MHGLVFPYEAQLSHFSFEKLTLNGKNILSMLCKVIPDVTEDKSIFMQDGVPAHYYRPIVNYLNNHFPKSWIDRDDSLWNGFRYCHILCLVTFFSLGHIKGMVHWSHPIHLDELENKICTVFHQIDERLGRDMPLHC